MSLNKRRKTRKILDINVVSGGYWPIIQKVLNLFTVVITVAILENA
jgi:hypothetical protein